VGGDKGAALALFSCFWRHTPRLYTHLSAAELMTATPQPQAPPTHSNLTGHTPHGDQSGTAARTRSPALEPPMRGRFSSPSRGGTTEGAAAETNPLKQHWRQSVRRGQGGGVN